MAQTKQNLIKTLFDAMVAENMILDALIKGGPGSGYHRHAGRPGERGGSAPSNGLSGESSPKNVPFRAPSATKTPVDDALVNYNFHAHPLLEMYVGPRDTSLSRNDWLYRVRGQRKNEIVTALSAGTGLTYEEANEFIKQWSISSNDSSMSSLHIQEAAADLFGTELTPWQKENLDEIRGERKTMLAEMLDGLPDGKAFDAQDAIYVLSRELKAGGYTRVMPFELKALDRWSQELNAGEQPSKAEFIQQFAALEAEISVKTRKALAFTYQETQRKLKEAGVTEVHLFRGAALSKKDRAGLEVGKLANVATNALSSWSFSRATADMFSDGYGGAGSKAVVVDAVVPASRIYATAVTGPGCLTEWEMIVIGSPEDGVRVYKIDEDKVKATVIKGGPGSGFHRHKGRLGHRGGSMDDGIENDDDDETDDDRETDDEDKPTHKPAKRVWTGQQHEGPATLSKLETGALGEAAVMDVMSQIYGVPFGPVNVGMNNAPFDVVGGNQAIEVKAGLATNGKTAQQWRATIGQPGKSETALLAMMDSEAKRTHNEWKMKAILDRKHALLKKLSEKSGQQMQPKTVALIMAGDGSAADMFSFDGFHLRLPWNKHAIDDHFLGTYDFINKKMHWRKGGKPTKAAFYVGESLLYSTYIDESFLHSLTVGPLSELQKAALLEVDKDFATVLRRLTAKTDAIKRAMVGAVQIVPKDVASAIVKSMVGVVKGGRGSGNRGKLGRPTVRGGSAPSGFDHRKRNAKIDALKRRNPSAVPVVVRMSPRQQEDYAALYDQIRKRDSLGWARIQEIEKEEKFAPLILGGTSDLWWVEDGAYRLAIMARRGKFNFFAYFNSLPTKGGPGSGYFTDDGHAGRPGKRGGSADDGIPNESAAAAGGGGNKLTAGALTPAGRTPSPRGAGALGASTGATNGRTPLDFTDPRIAAAAVSSYVQSSPSLHKIASASAPLDAAYLTAPEGQARGSQFLPAMMKDLGIDKHLPTKAKLAHGAKSLYLPLTDDEDLNRLLSKVPPDPAHSTGFWVPGKAAGGGAHGKVKPEAKQADGKKLEKARKKEENRIKPLMMSAVIQAGLTGQWADANALQLQYQITGNLGTFALTMGYSTINMGTQIGTVVLDRNDIIVDPEFVKREPVGYGTGRSRSRIRKSITPKGRIVKK